MQSSEPRQNHVIVALLCNTFAPAEMGASPGRGSPDKTTACTNTAVGFGVRKITILLPRYIPRSYTPRRLRAWSCSCRCPA
jgi:hypothetical protein